MVRSCRIHRCWSDIAKDPVLAGDEGYSGGLGCGRTQSGRAFPSLREMVGVERVLSG